MPDPYVVRPDTEFLGRILAGGGEDAKKCFQCATCSVVCELSEGDRPFPRREMLWAQWGLKDRLIADPNVWLCHQCNDCSTHCPRGARPGDVMAAVRREHVLQYAFPSFLARWVSQPKYLLLLLLIPVVLLGLAFVAKDQLGDSLGLSPSTGDTILFSYWSKLPQWLLILFFSAFAGLAFLGVVAGVARFWRAMKAADARNGFTTPAKGVLASVVAVLRSILTHDRFSKCTTDRSRLVYHMLAFYSFIALFVVSLWVMTTGINPLAGEGFVYPFSFWNPWRMLANLGGAALLVACALMIRERMKKAEEGGSNTFFDWSFVWLMLLVAATGFAVEAMHYMRVVPQRYVAYLVHLVAAFALLVYLPYSKFAHLIYRTTAMVYVEHAGVNSRAQAVVAHTPPAEMAAADESQSENAKPAAEAESEQDGADEAQGETEEQK